MFKIKPVAQFSLPVLNFSLFTDVFHPFQCCGFCRLASIKQKHLDFSPDQNESFKNANNFQPRDGPALEATTQFVTFEIRGQTKANIARAKSNCIFIRRNALDTSAQCIAFPPNKMEKKQIFKSLWPPAHFPSSRTRKST